MAERSQQQPDSTALSTSVSTTVKDLEQQLAQPGVHDTTSESPPPTPYSALPPRRRWLILIIVTATGFYGPLSGGIYLPALPLFERVFDTTGAVINGTVSVYMVAFAITPLIWATLSDVSGRRPIYLVSLALFIGSNILLAAVPPNIPALFILRIVQATGACGVTSVGAGTVADIIEPRSRASALGIFLLGPQVGPILGPLIGGLLASDRGERWRWIFGFLAISCAAVYLGIFLLLPETLRSLVGTGEVYAKGSWMVRPHFRQRRVVEEGTFPVPKRAGPKLYLKILCNPAISIIGVAGSLSFAAFYALLVTFPHVLEGTYGFSSAEVGYSYLVPGITLMAGSMAIGRLSDLLKRRGQKPTSKADAKSYNSRLSLQILGLLLSAAGVALYGWFSAYKIHVAVVLLTSVLAAVGMGTAFVTATSYQTEYYPAYAASMVALAGLLRNIAAAIVAAVLDPLVRKMGRQWFFTGLAFMDVLSALGIAVVTVKDEGWRKARERNEVERVEGKQ